MTTTPYPTAEDLNTLAAAYEALVNHGVASAGATYQISDFAASIYAHGWTYEIDRAGGDFRATITHAGSAHIQSTSVGIGWSLEAALAFALEKSLNRLR